MKLRGVIYSACFCKPYFRLKTLADRHDVGGSRNQFMAVVDSTIFAAAHRCERASVPL